MQLKTVEIEGKTYAEVQDGKPVYVDGGKDIAFDAPSTVQTISRLNGEAKGHREAKEAAEAKLKAFEGIADPEAAKKALETVTNLDAKKLVEAGQVETVRAEAIKATEEKYKPIVDERDKLLSELHAEKIGGAFARSKFIAEKAAIPADLVQARFGQHFKLEDGKVIAYDAAGNKLYSRARAGELAEPDEALELLIDAYPYKDQILKGDVKGGGGAGNGGGNSNAKTIARSEFERLSPTDQMAKINSGVTVTD